MDTLSHIHAYGKQVAVTRKRYRAHLVFRNNVISHLDSDMDTDTHTQTFTDRVNLCIQLPMTACINFQILVLANETVKESVAPSLQATIQHNMPASVLCSAATDLFALLSLWWARQSSP